ncbi:MAG: hydrogenase expression/formation protein HypE [Euryarchaeota archaeon]|nr:hydrogenase expression/formation protein HypE [Euryarchaeota archaeon]
MSHGAGGANMQKMIGDLIVPVLSNRRWRRPVIQVPLDALDDSAVVDGIVFTTDSHTVRPIFFPGGDIGSLSVAGTVNDLSVVGAEPLALSCGLVLEEGLAFEELERILRSMAATCKRAGVPVVTGDTKVVERGAVQKIVVNTSGIGRRSPLLDRNLKEARRHRKVGGNWLLDSNLRPGDAIILSGAVGDHGIAVLSQREGYGFGSVIKSDVAPLNMMVEAALKAGGVVSGKDPTRGGLANLLNEWAEKSKTGIVVEEGSVPVHDGVRTACEMLGIDPLSIGNEGKAVFGVVRERAEAVLRALRRTKEGREAALIGEATASVKGVVLHTTVGGRRILEQPAGDPIPRIC